MTKNMPSWAPPAWGWTALGVTARLGAQVVPTRLGAQLMGWLTG